MKYKPKICIFSKLIFEFLKLLIFHVFYMFRARGLIFKKTFIYTGIV